MSFYASVCNNTVVMWPLFIELIVSVYVKITRGISFWLECGHPDSTSLVFTLTNLTL